MSDTTDGVAPPRGAPVGLQQAAFTQRKLEKFYTRMYKLLFGGRDWLQAVEDVLVWNKPMASAALYVVVHWLFV